MGFGTELQGQASHDSLVSLQQFEIKLLQTMRQCVLQRAKCEKQYGQSLTDMVNTASRLENPFSFQTPLIKSWSVIVKETQNLANLVKDNAEKLQTETAEKIQLLIEDKKSARNIYNDERKRIDDDLRNTRDEMSKTQQEYERAMVKLHQDKIKYEDAKNKGKAAKIESGRQKYVATTERLHRTHNDFVLSLREFNIQQRDLSRVVLPGLLDQVQELQETGVANTKEILQELASLSNQSAEPFSKLHAEIAKSVQSVRPQAEYDEFLSQCRSDPVSNAKVEFPENLLENYTGTLKPNEIVVDALSEKHLQVSVTRLRERVEACTNEKNTRDAELQNAEANTPKESPTTQTPRVTPLREKLTLLTKRREAAESYTVLERLRAVLSVASQPLEQVKVSDLPVPDVDKVKVGGVTSSSNASLGECTEAGDSFSQSAKEKINTITRQMKNKFKARQRAGGHEPPPPPSRVFGESAASQESIDGGGIVRSPSSVSGYETCSTRTNNPPIESNGAVGGETRSVREAPWFHGVLPRDEVVRLLQNDGDYLVRESKNKKTGEVQYVLSVMWQESKHFIIQGDEGSWRFEGESFPSICELVEHQAACGQPVTKKSLAILSHAVLREQWEINNDDVKLGVRLGNGNFGDVFKGTYANEEVAVKTCKETLSDDLKMKFLQEGRILKQYNHPNIVRFVGIAAQRQPVMIVMEYVSGGALLTFLRRMEKNSSLRLPPKKLVRMCVDAAAGMAYLEDKNCIHRDLAARNCLVGKENVVKISDFGMSREEQEYKVSSGLKQIPIKWTAPEALNYGTYTTASDVWSYGILVWEIFALGNTPYSGLTNNQAREKVDEGYRMPAPEGTPPRAYTVMEQCWAQEPKNRPRFEQVHAQLTALWSAL